MTEDFTGLKAIFSGLSEAVLVLRGDTIVYSNAVADLLPAAEQKSLISASASGDEAVFNGRRYKLTSTEHGGLRIVIISRDLLPPPERSEAQSLAKLLKLTSRRSAELSSLVLEMRESGALSGAEGSSGAELASLVQKIQHATAIVERFSASALLEDELKSGRRSLEIKPLDAGLFVREQVSTLRFFTAERGINLTHTCSISDSASAEFDPLLIEIALLQIVCASLERLEPGCTLCLSAESGAAGTVISMNDDGKIPPFKPLPSLPGCIVAMHGGTLAVKYVEGKGGFASFSLPRHSIKRLPLSAAELSETSGGMALVLRELSPWLRSTAYDPRLMD